MNRAAAQYYSRRDFLKNDFLNVSDCATLAILENLRLGFLTIPIDSGLGIISRYRRAGSLG